MKAIFKRAAPIACLIFGGCDGSSQRLQCGAPGLTAECQGLLKACEGDAGSAAQTIPPSGAATRLTACLQGTYAARCNAACQVAE
jgi:hypothetical protein